MTKSINCLTTQTSDENLALNDDKRPMTRMQQAKGIIHPENEHVVITAIGEVPYRIYRRVVSGRLLLGQTLQYPFLDSYEIHRLMYHTSMFFEVITVKTPHEGIHPDAYKYVEECKASLLYNEEAGILVIDMRCEAGTNPQGRTYDFIVLRMNPDDIFTEMLGHAMDIAHSHVMDCYTFLLKEFGMDSKFLRLKKLKERLHKCGVKISSYRRRRQRKWVTLIRSRMEDELYRDVCDAIFHQAPLKLYNTYRLDVTAFQEKMHHLQGDAAVDYIMALFALGYLTDRPDGGIKLVSKELRNKYIHMAPDLLRDVAKLR